MISDTDPVRKQLYLALEREFREEGVSRFKSTYNLPDEEAFTPQEYCKIVTYRLLPHHVTLNTDKGVAYLTSLHDVAKNPFYNRAINGFGTVIKSTDIPNTFIFGSSIESFVHLIPPLDVRLTDTTLDGMVKADTIQPILKSKDTRLSWDGVEYVCARRLRFELQSAMSLVLSGPGSPLLKLASLDEALSMPLQDLISVGHAASLGAKYAPENELEKMILGIINKVCMMQSIWDGSPILTDGLRCPIFQRSFKDLLRKIDKSEEVENLV